MNHFSHTIRWPVANFYSKQNSQILNKFMLEILVIFSNVLYAFYQQKSAKSTLSGGVWHGEVIKAT